MLLCKLQHTILISAEVCEHGEAKQTKPETENLWLNEDYKLLMWLSFLDIELASF